jgi:hypothetical protein
MSFKDLEEKKHPPRVETPEEMELRARAAARHKAKEAKREEHRGAKEKSPPGGAPRGEPPE